MNRFYLFFYLLLNTTFLLNAQNSAATLPEAAPAAVDMSAKQLALIDGHIQQYIGNGSLPGGVFLVARQGKIVYYKNFGHNALDKKEAYQKDDIFRLASMTKAVTTVAIMQLFEQGKLGLDDPIFYYIPAFAQSKILKDYNEQDTTYTTTPVEKPITIRHLLTHSSGITYGTFNPGKIQAIYAKHGANAFGLSHPTMTTEEMANQIASVPLMFEPGTKYMYGLNMEVLGRIVEVASGMTLGEYFKKYIFDPLGMADTRFYFPKEKHDRLVPVYTYSAEKKMVMADMATTGLDPNYPHWDRKDHFAGGGGLSGTAMDYAKFIQALCNGGTYNGQRILGRKTVELIASDQMALQNAMGTGYSKLPGITYGLGFALRTEAGAAWSPKSPGTFEWGGVFNTKFFIDPAEELIFVGMTQISPFTRPDFWDRLYAIIYGALE
ncbi:MAG: serine hydrolase domain-containing protein [Bacteroidota bacterium]